MHLSFNFRILTIMINITEFISREQSQLQTISYVIIFRRRWMNNFNLINCRYCYFYLTCWTCWTCWTCLIYLISPAFSYPSLIFMNCSPFYISEISLDHLEDSSFSYRCWLAPNSTICFAGLGLFNGVDHSHLPDLYFFSIPTCHYIFDNPQ